MSNGEFPYTGEEAHGITGAEGQNIVEQPAIPTKEELKTTLRAMLGETTEVVTDTELLRRTCNLPDGAEVSAELIDSCQADIAEIVAEIKGE